MTSYRRFIGFMSPPAPTGDAAFLARFATLAVRRPGELAKSRQEAALVDCAEERGPTVSGVGAKRS
ncbi:MAG: hypothetical protein H6941_07995 [Candidatus Accumulibacter sp.]|nr:hypothetical protein [Accumulibacter sp.]MCP5228545.1 hypothetical protein [Accumulibacter sp.]